MAFADVVAGLRPGTPDNAPVLGPAETKGLVLATGHFRSGVLLAPVTADTIAGYLRTGEPDPLWAAFAPGRFRAPAATVPASTVPASTVPAGTGS
jgi:glycine oxidase